MDNNEILLKTIEKENKLILDNHSKLEKKYAQIKEKNKELLEEKNRIEEQLNSILSSRSYKAIKKIKKILGR